MNPRAFIACELSEDEEDESELALRQKLHQIRVRRAERRERIDATLFSANAQMRSAPEMPPTPVIFSTAPKRAAPDSVRRPDPHVHKKPKPAPKPTVRFHRFFIVSSLVTLNPNPVRQMRQYKPCLHRSC